MSLVSDLLVKVPDGVMVDNLSKISCWVLLRNTELSLISSSGFLVSVFLVAYGGQLFYENG